MASRNHTIRVPDEVWAEWTDYAEACRASVTKMLVACVNAHKAETVLKAMADGSVQPTSTVNPPSENRTFRPFTKDQQLKKGKK